MSHLSDWQAAKADYEKATGKGKPAKNFLFWRKSSGIESALKDFEKAMQKENLPDATAAVIDLQKAIKSYRDVANSEKKDKDGTDYSKEITKLLGELGGIETRVQTERSTLSRKLEQASGDALKQLGAEESKLLSLISGIGTMLNGIAGATKERKKREDNMAKLRKLLDTQITTKRRQELKTQTGSPLLKEWAKVEPIVGKVLEQYDKEKAEWTRFDNELRDFSKKLTTRHSEAEKCVANLEKMIADKDNAERFKGTSELTSVKANLKNFAETEKDMKKMLDDVKAGKVEEIK
jgi:hypothetical protein